MHRPKVNKTPEYRKSGFFVKKHSKHSKLLKSSKAHNVDHPKGQALKKSIIKITCGSLFQDMFKAFLFRSGVNNALQQQKQNYKKNPPNMFYSTENCWTDYSVCMSIQRLVRKVRKKK